MREEIHAYIDSCLTDKPVKIGILSCDHIRGKEIFSFEANPEWLNNDTIGHLDPNIETFAGIQRLPYLHTNFGLFLDSCPDRWGRKLMEKREAMMAKKEGRSPRKLLEKDYLLGVNDITRMGALRLKIDPEGPFVVPASENSVPHLQRLREIEQAARQYDEDPENIDEWLKTLYDPGSSLGGARPKANVIDGEGSLWIAKFAKKKDATNVQVWEQISCRLAAACGIFIPQTALIKAAGDGKDIFLSKRFDREGCKRIHLASAMTMLGRTDGEGSDGASYLEIAEWLMEHSQNPIQNLEQLWRRIAFNMCISNCDDHLRNHAFILTREGWRLSPAYDLNPDPLGTQLRLTVDGKDSEIHRDLLIESSEYFGIEKSKADKLLDNILDATRSWKIHARNCGISPAEIKEMEPAFGRISPKRLTVTIDKPEDHHSSGRKL